MAEIKKVFNASSLPIAFSRGNPIPIDKSSVWYSKTDMENYYSKEQQMQYGVVAFEIEKITK